MVNIEPAQDLHGYDSPWPAGGGENLLNPSNVSVYGLGQAFGLIWTWDSATGAATVSGTWNIDSTGGAFRLLNVPSTVRETCNITAFSDSANFNLIRWQDGENVAVLNLKNMAKNQSYSFKVYPVAYVGSTAPTTYSPYSNICPITGWTGAQVSRTGKNLIDDAYADTSVNNFLWIYRNVGLLLKANQTYTFSVNQTVDSIRIVSVDESVIYASISSATSSLSYSPTADVLGVFRVWKNDGGTLSGLNPQLELGSTATDYEPYQGDTYDIAFPSEAGTVYGGTLDVVNGVLTVDRAMVDLGTLTWTKITTSGDHWRFWAMLNTMRLRGQMISSQYRQIGATEQYIGAQGIANQASESNVLAMVSDERYADAAAFKAAMSGVQLCYELATPVTYQLTPQEIALLRGDNALWADTGDVMIDVSAVPAPISGRTGLKLYHSGSTQNMPDLVEVDWENELGTVYGGTLDIVSGVLTVDRATETITKDSSFYSFSVGTVNAIASVDFTSGAPLYVSDISSYNGAISSTFAELQNYWTSGRNNETPAANYGFAYNSSGRCCFRIVDTSITTLAEFKAVFPDTQICYKLATPINRHLSPTQVNMLLGANTLWSDDGNTTLVYKAKK